MRPLPVRSVVAATCLWGALVQSSVFGQAPSDVSAAKYLPADVVIVVTARDLGLKWREISESAVFKRIMEFPRVEQAMDGEQMRNFRMGQKFIEGMFGQSTEDLLQSFTQQGATFAWKNESEFLLIANPKPEVFKQLSETLKALASAAALGNRDKGNDQLFSANYRGVDAYGIGPARIAFCKGWILVCSSSEIGKTTLDRLLGDRAVSIADQKWFQQATQFAQAHFGKDPPTLTAVLNMEVVRADGKLKGSRGKDAGQEFFFGGILDVLESAPFAVASAQIDRSEIRLQVGTPRTPRSDDLSDYFYGAGGVQAAPQPIDVPGRILSGRWFRDIGLFWRMAPQLIKDENALAGIAKAESDISTLLGGMVTVSDVFQFLGPDIEFIAVQPIDDPQGDPPSIRIPAFGITGTLREPAKAQPALRLAFQQVVSFTNLNAAAGAYPPLEVLAEKEGNQLLLSGSYISMDGGAKANRPVADLYKNFSPTLGFQNEQFVLASHRDLAKTILGAKRPKPSTANKGELIDNTILELWPGELAAAGELNRETLIAQRMLSTGQDRDVTASEIDTAIELLKQFSMATLRLQASDAALILNLESQMTSEVHSSNPR